MEKRAIHLQPAEREKLSKLVRNGKIEAAIVKRAYMLLHSDADLTDEAIAHFLFCSADTVRRTRVRYLTEGLNAALEDKAHPGQASLLNAQQEAYLSAFMRVLRNCWTRFLTKTVRNDNQSRIIYWIALSCPCVQ
jgi:hypothetical protein